MKVKYWNTYIKIKSNIYFYINRKVKYLVN